MTKHMISFVRRLPLAELRISAAGLTVLVFTVMLSYGSHWN